MTETVHSKVSARAVLLATAAIATTIGFSASAAGQSVPQASNTAQDDNSLPDIVITARKRNESLQDVPISASVQTGERLAALGVRDVKDALAVTPNVSFPDQNQGNDNTDIVIRGISSNTRNVGFESGVGVYVDGVYLGRPLSANQELIGIDRVEVLRGPQGTLFGKNSISGALNIITVQPKLNDFTAGIAGQYARFNDVYGSAYINLPLGKVSALRLSGFGHSSDGYIRNVFDNTLLGNAGGSGVRGQLLVEPSSDLSITVSADYRRDRMTPAFPEVILNAGNPAFAPVIPGPYTTDINTKPTERRDIWGTSATIAYALPGGGSITSITAYRDARVADTTDNDNDPANLVYVNFSEHERHFTQELRYASPASKPLKYVLGVWLLDQQADASKGGFLVPPNNVTVLGRVNTTSFAAFADAQWRPTEKLILGAGIRYTHESKRLVGFSQTTSPLLAGIFPSFAAVTDRRAVDNVAPTLSLSYKFSSSATGYAKVARGFKSGGWNVDFTSPPDAPLASGRPVSFGDENLTSYEIGFKSLLFDRRVRLNLAGFYMDYRNQQVQQRDGFRFPISNAGSSELYGFEGDVEVTPTKGLVLSGGGGYTRGRYRHFANCSATGLDCSGNRLSNAPEWTANVAADWRIDFSPKLTFALHADYQYRGDNYSNSPTNDPLVLTPATSTLNASIGIGGSARSWRATLFVDNLLNKVNSAGRFIDTIADPGTVSETYTKPRVLGVRLSFDLGGGK